ncbi:Glycogen operon protein GlgX [Burkholderiales bacterium]|nr:Glycogen operon protein GlgX [Burkholderiales bacterium]
MRRADSGSPVPLGVTLGNGGANVAVFSAHATAIDLCLFDPADGGEQERITLPGRTGDIIHGFVAGIAAGDRYGLRARGPYDLRSGHRFNPAKLLVDPYARAVDRPFALHPAMLGESADATRSDIDSAPFVPKGIVTPWPAPAPARRPRVPWAQTILYELHVRGFTRAHPGIPDALRGTCAGLAHPAALAHLTRLGITTVELMPIAAAIDERHIAELGLTNYWGYNPAALFVPDPRLAPGGIDELRACVAALQAVGIEVVLDVVLNHTGEGDARGPTLSLRGLDNATYYRTFADDRARYVDDAGCGNTLALDRPPVLRLAMDVLRYYAVAAGVDGFRFDLATTLGRRDDGFDPAAPLLQAVAQDPDLRDLKLIAEPWDVGPGGHRLGAFPAQWGEWNDRYRDTVRRFWRGDAGLSGDLATRLAGSADILAPRSRPPSRSVNFVAAHDGFALADLVAFVEKHNERNGEGNRDGSDANFSWNHGVEGPTPDAAIRAKRERDVRNLLATLLLSRGTPMLAMGDELGRTQHGNNNAYAQDNPLTWIDWERADGDLVDFVAALVDLRRRHPALRADRWLTGAPVDGSGIADVEWRHPEGRAMTGSDWANPGCRSLVAVLYAGASEAAAGDRVAVALNAGEVPVEVRWPDAREGCAWRSRIDTSLRAGRPESTPEVAGETGAVAPRSVVVLAEEAGIAPRRRHSGVEPEVLERLAAAAGIAREWWDLAGERHVVGVDTKRALLAAMGLSADTTAEARDRVVGLANARERRRLPPMIVAREGRRANVAIAVLDEPQRLQAAVRLRNEDGTEQILPFRWDDLPVNVVTAADGRQVTQRILALPSLPMGFHTLGFDGDAAVPCRIVVAPGRCFLPPEMRAGGRRFGLASHLYSLRRRGDQGIGDLTTLSLLGEATARAGGSIVAVNPLHALFPEDRERASPYHPSDRRFLDPIYVDVGQVPDLAASRDARSLLAQYGPRIADLSARAHVDYVGVWEVKRAVLDACFAQFELRSGADPLVAGFDRFVAGGGLPLRQFAIFEAIAAAHPREPWQHWPDDLRRPDAPGVADFAGRHARRVRFALYLQWLAERQLAAAAGHARASGLTSGFFRDLAIGAAPDGAEPWANPGDYARGVSIGAPPDDFSPTGQIWNLPPPNPEAMAASACARVRDVLVANMRHAGALRIDHVMGLSRLFWIPEGAAAAEGAYVGYPLDALLGVMAIESVRARCLVVGEDLGTVPEGLRERLAAADVLSSRVLWFERDGDGFADPSSYPAKAAACVSTHDLPTIAGWWTGADIDEKQALELLTAEAADAERTERLASKVALAAALDRAGVAPGTRVDVEAPHDVAITTAIHRFVGGSPSALVMVQAEDLAGETMAANLPGVDRGRPNWRRKLDVEVEALWRTEAGAQVIADFAPGRTEG